MRVVFRADASADLGGGHIMRCLALASALSARGATPLFVVNKGALETVAALGNSGFDILQVPDDPASASPLLMERWPQRADAAVVDHYGLSAEFEHQLRAFAPSIMVIDDLADRPHDCDLVIDQTYGRVETDYRGLLPAHAGVLSGTGFALLRPEFRELREAAVREREDGPSRRRVLISFGLSDVAGLTPAVVRALRDDGCQLEVAVGSGAASLPEVRRSVEETENATLHQDAPDMAALMSASDIAVGASGSMSWERCALALPAVVVVMADNQREIAARLAAAGAACVVDAAAPDAAQAIARSVGNLLGDPPAWHAMSNAAALICDGGGAERVADALLKVVAEWEEAGNSVLELRPAAPADSLSFWIWRNSDDARRFATNSAPIEWETHRGWFARQLRSEGSRYFVAERGRRAIASIRFDAVDDQPGCWVASIAVSRGSRGRDVARQALGEACHRLFQSEGAERIMAQIHAENIASLRLFEAVGFRPVDSTSGSAFLDYVLPACRRASTQH